MEYLDYGMQVYQLPTSVVLPKPPYTKQYTLVVEEKQLNKIDIVGFFSQKEN
jgi:hypothetical protein